MIGFSASSSSPAEQLLVVDLAGLSRHGTSCNGIQQHQRLPAYYGVGQSFVLGAPDDGSTGHPAGFRHTGARAAQLVTAQDSDVMFKWRRV